MFVCMIVCVVLLYTIVDFKNSLELVLYVCYILTLNKTLNFEFEFKCVFFKGCCEVNVKAVSGGPCTPFKKT